MQAQKKLAQAIELHKAGRIFEAESLYNQVFKEQRNNPSTRQILSIAYSGLGGAYWDANNLQKAEEYYLKGINLNSHNFEALNNLAMLYSTQKKYTEAVSYYEKALKINPNCAEIHNNLGSVYYEIDEKEKAKKCHEQAIKLRPNYPEAYFNLGNVYRGSDKTKNSMKTTEDLDKALQCYTKAIEQAPDFAKAYINLGMIYFYLNEPEKELLCYRKAEELSPNSAEILNNIGNFHRDAQRVEKAVEYFEKAITLDPNNIDAHINASISYLALKNFDKGWKYYKYRLFDNSAFQDKKRCFPQPVWQGEPLNGKTIYVYWEQGFGDTINFIRFLPVLESLGAKVLFQSQKELYNLLKYNSLNAEIIVEEPKEFDYHVPLLSLPGLLGVNESNIPSSGRYLTVEPEKTAFYKEKYFNTDKFKIGINWQCKNILHVDQYRSVPNISYFYPLLRLENIEIYSFQKGCGTEQLNNLPEDIKITNLGDEFADFSDTAAALENIDLLISVDTSVPHLAGALGKQAWVLLQTVPDFRWFLAEECTQWYKSLRLFRQSSTNNWEELIQRVKLELKKEISKRCTT